MNKWLIALALALSCGSALADSPLADAIENGRRDAALELIQKGADVNAAQADGATPLHWAAYKPSEARCESGHAEPLRGHAARRSREGRESHDRAATAEGRRAGRRRERRR
jgi:ankyrin repeat protein